VTALSFPYAKSRIRPSAAFPGVTEKLTPVVPVTLLAGNRSALVYPVVDSGADYTVFSEEVATELLGLDVRSGVAASFCGTTGDMQTAFCHPITLSIGDARNGVSYMTTVAFAPLPADTAGLLGQLGFFDHFAVTLDRRQDRITLRWNPPARAHHVE
jgi:hypothetical protein